MWILITLSRFIKEEEILEFELILEEIKNIEEFSNICEKCGDKLIWGGDHDGEDYDESLSDYIVSNYSCPTCENIVLVKL